MGLKLRNILSSSLLKLFLGFIFLFFYTSVFCQLSISKKLTPFGMVNQVLKGKGVDVSDVKYSGASNAYGTFKAANSNLGLTEGIILSTGNVYGAIGPNKYNGPKGAQALSTDFSALGYSLLGSNTQDAAVLEFDFIPQGDTIEFKYVFASEEYPEYVNEVYNDIFGFFISGPNISGYKNIALLPDGESVAINNVNQLKNSQYYVSNDGGQTLEFDGFTVVLTARAIVECGKKYHLILAIADVKDGAYDSAIFLSAKSLSVPTKYETFSSLSNYYFDNDSTKMYENCTSAKVKIQRAQQFQNRNSTLNITIEGSAILNKDYSNTIPNSIVFSKGEVVKEIQFDALYDKEKDTLDSLIIVISGNELCNPIKVKFYIENINPLNVVLKDDTVHCKGVPITLKPEVSGGLKPYSYLWSDGSFYDSINVYPLVTTNYTVEVNDQCFNQPITVINKVVVPQRVTLSVNQPPDIVEICPYKPTYIFIKPSDGGGGYKYNWFENNILISSDKLDTVKPKKTSFYKILVTDRCGDTISTKFKYTISSPPLITTMTGDSLVCYKDSSLMKIKAQGGFGAYTYRWQNLTSLQDNAYSNLLFSSWYYAYVGDQCKTFEVKDSFYVKVLRPEVNFEISGNPITNSVLNLINKSQNATKYSWIVDRKLISNELNTTTMLSDSALHSFRLIITNDIGCVNDTTIYMMIYYPPSIYIPNAFTPDGGLFNNVFYPVLTSIKEMDFSIYDRWGELIFHTDDFNHAYWDGTYKGQMCSNDVYIYKLKTNSVIDEKKEFVGHVSLIR